MKTAPYDAHAADYDDWFSRNRPAYESELRAVGSFLPSEGAGVEIGVGTGRFAGELGIPLGVEPSKAMRSRARERGIRVICGTAEALPLKSGRFDYAVMVTVLCFFDDAGKALREAHRILKPGGSLVAAFIDRATPLGREYEERKGQTLYYREATFRSAEEVAGLLRGAGFGALSFRQTIFSDPGTLRAAQRPRDGHGEGCFAVVRAVR